MQRLDLVLKLQKQETLKVTLWSFVFAVFFSWQFFENGSIFLHGVVAVLFFWLVYIPWHHHAMRLIIKDVYQGDTKAMAEDHAKLSSSILDEDSDFGEDEASPPGRIVTLTIIKTPEESAGTFKGAKFYDWLLVTDENSATFKLQFLRTMDIEEGGSYPLEDNEILFAPGIVYKNIGQVGKITK